jgi:hypothetical protein
MIAKKHRTPHVQTELVAIQHLAENEATAGAKVAAIRLPPGAILTGGLLNTIEAFSAGTVQPILIDPLGNETPLHSLALDAATPGALVEFDGAELPAPYGGWVYLDCAGADNSLESGDVAALIRYYVDGRWTEVLPEVGIAPADV